MRTTARAGFLGALTLALVPLGCGQIVARQAPTPDRPAVPEQTVERLKACVEEYGDQLPKGNHSFNPQIRVNREGDKLDVTTDDIPRTAYDFGACTRVALRDMRLLRVLEQRLELR